MKIFKQLFIEVTIKYIIKVRIEFAVIILIRLSIYLKYFSFRVFKNIIFVFDL